MTLLQSAEIDIVGTLPIGGIVRGERSGAERQITLGFRILIAHQAERHVPSGHLMYVRIVVAEQFRTFQIVHGVTPIAEDVGERAHI